eukprot:TRINITY_DN7873_c0_g2_i1.p1 TRINITY_DN7873_c0_g2~~TRINITY_DN7873_c0_g2_i1.p1  ORF type:complete len:281 (+),score=36.56 TRINITY_DN7873_c0_g2_i1:60-902(+)
MEVKAKRNFYFQVPKEPPRVEVSPPGTRGNSRDGFSSPHSLLGLKTTSSIGVSTSFKIDAAFRGLREVKDFVIARETDSSPPSASSSLIERPALGSLSRCLSNTRRDEASPSLDKENRTPNEQTITSIKGGQLKALLSEGHRKKITFAQPQPEDKLYSVYSQGVRLIGQLTRSDEKTFKTSVTDRFLAGNRQGWAPSVPGTSRVNSRHASAICEPPEQTKPERRRTKTHFAAPSKAPIVPRDKGKAPRVRITRNIGSKLTQTFFKPAEVPRLDRNLRERR